MSDSMATTVGGPCVGTRKNGQPCRGIGTIFDPDLNGLVCEWHTGPQITKRREQAYLGFSRESYEATIQRLSDEALDALLTDLRRFRSGEPLARKTVELLREIVSGEDSRQKATKLAKKLLHVSQEGPVP